MAKQLINTGPVVKDTLKAGATKINANFNELYTNLGNGSSLQFAVDIASTPLSGQTLQYNTASGKFVPATVSSGGGGTASNSFSTISVSGQANVLADSVADTLTLVAGPNITITTNAATDAITISGSSGGGGGSGVSTGAADRLAYYAASGAVVQDTGAALTWNGTNLNITGTVTATGDVSYVRAYFDTLAGLQAVSAVTWHGMVAHVHEAGGRMYYAHGGAWQPMANSSDLNIFKTIAVAGQTSVEADTATDTLTLIAGTNISITTNASNDSITINASGGGSAGNLNSITDVTITTPSIGQVLKYNGTGWINDTDATSVGGGGGTVTSVGGTGTVNGLTLTGTVTSTGNLTLGGTLGSIGNSQLSNSTVSGVALGGNLFALTAGTGVSFNTGTTYNGSAAITINATGAGATTFAALTDTGGLTVDRFYLPAITRLAVIANSSSSYSFDQYGGTTNPTIYAISGTTIAFDLSVGQGNHPFAIRFGGSNYNTGLTHVTSTGTVTTGTNAQGKTSGTLYWKLPANISGAYQYICLNHAGAMVGTITVKDIATI